mgnify:CR=1 FL=1|jgi:hypothetical protein
MWFHPCATPWGVGVVSASSPCIRGYLSPAAAVLGGPEQRLAACCRRSAEASQSPRWARIRAFQRRPWLKLLAGGHEGEGDLLAQLSRRAVSLLCLLG